MLTVHVVGCWGGRWREGGGVEEFHDADCARGRLLGREMEGGRCGGAFIMLTMNVVGCWGGRWREGGGVEEFHDAGCARGRLLGREVEGGRGCGGVS